MPEREPILHSALNIRETTPSSGVSERTESQRIDTREFKKLGDLEKKGIGPLRPTEISPQAREKLTSWGVDPDVIKALQKFTSSFRYDLVPEKAKRLAEESVKEPIKVFKKDEQEYVNLSSFFDTDGRFDGQCIDIAKQWIIQIHESQLIEELNRNLKENKVVPTRHIGKSKTHFCREGDIHWWNGLALVDAKDNVLEQIYIDAAFQNIHTKGESKYEDESKYKKIEAINPMYFTNKKQYNVPIGRIDINEDNFTVSESKVAILGVSSNYEYAYGLGFARDKNTNAIKPILERTYSDGSYDYYIIGNEGQIARGYRHTEVSDQNMEDVEQILKIAANFNFVETKKPPKKEHVIWRMPKKGKIQQFKEIFVSKRSP
jgi:hypothetical protein